MRPTSTSLIQLQATGRGLRNEQEQIKEIYVWQKQMNEYIKYLSVNLMLKQSVSVHWPGEQYYNYPGPGFRNPDKIIGNLHYRYLWSNLKILSFNEFVNSNYYKP